MCRAGFLEGEEEVEVHIEEVGVAEGVFPVLYSVGAGEPVGDTSRGRAHRRVAAHLSEVVEVAAAGLQEHPHRLGAEDLEAVVGLVGPRTISFDLLVPS